MCGSKTVRKLGHTNKKASHLVWFTGRDTRTTEPANASSSLLRRAFVKILGTVLIKLKQKRPQ